MVGFGVFACVVLWLFDSCVVCLCLICGLLWCVCWLEFGLVMDVFVCCYVVVFCFVCFVLFSVCVFIVCVYFTLTVALSDLVFNSVDFFYFFLVWLFYCCLFGYSSWYC